MIVDYVVYLVGVEVGTEKFVLGTFPPVATNSGCEEQKKKIESTKRMTGVDEDFLGLFANSERGLSAATAAGTGFLTMTSLEEDKMRGARGCAAGDPTVLNTGAPGHEKKTGRHR